MTDADSRRSNKTKLSPSQYDAVVMDLNGVVTDTAGVHASAWKSTFDEYFTRQGLDELFDIERDYRGYVDGKPRYDGVKSSLDARGISLPYGDPDDAPDQETVCGLGNRKNELFREKLRTEGVTVYPPSVTFIRDLREAGPAVAAASSSRNCQAAGIQDLFGARVDGLDLEHLGLAGKPAMDMFAEASRRLRSDPTRTIGIEDASSGVEALRKARFGLVVGVGVGEQAEVLRAHGADLVVADLSELDVVAEPAAAMQAARLPSALDRLDEILSGGKRMVFLDYDGTLTPIVDSPDAAIINDSMRAVLQRLSGLSEVAIISGRDLSKVH